MPRQSLVGYESDSGARDFARRFQRAYARCTNRGNDKHMWRVIHDGSAIALGFAWRHASLKPGQTCDRELTRLMHRNHDPVPAMLGRLVLRGFFGG